ncbi:MAG TPA: class I SAM-dependent methyltransferase [Pseudogracilibacillus sp.]|nr:class I SAM-dependent methyltransferase [Pseudogracilibacillus sp.]
MEDSTVVKLFTKLDEGIEKIKDHDTLYLDALADSLHYIHLEEAVTEEVKKNENMFKQIRKSFLAKINDRQAVHRAIQMALLKGMKDEVQSNHRMTPESIALFISYLIQKLYPNKEKLSLLNLASGTGNLLHTVLGQLEKDIDAYASEIDDTLIRISVMTANLLEQEIEYFHQDCLRPLFVDPVDIVISDLPVGYYPDEERAKEFELKAEEGMSYSHHLFIEQALTYTKKGGYVICLIPEFLFTSDQADILQKFLHEKAHIIGLFQLADSTFKAKEHKKSIFIFRKKGEATKNVKQPLLVMLPSLKNTVAMEDILVQINGWFEEEKERL